MFYQTGKPISGRASLLYHVPFTMFAHILQLPKKVLLVYVYINNNAYANAWATGIKIFHYVARLVSHAKVQNYI